MIKGAVVVVIVWYLDLQLPVQSVPFTTVVSSNPVHGEVYSIQQYEPNHQIIGDYLIHNLHRINRT